MFAKQSCLTVHPVSAVSLWTWKVSTCRPRLIYQLLLMTPCPRRPRWHQPTSRRMTTLRLWRRRSTRPASNTCSTSTISAHCTRRGLTIRPSCRQPSCTDWLSSLVFWATCSWLWLCWSTGGSGPCWRRPTAARVTISRRRSSSVWPSLTSYFCSSVCRTSWSSRWSWFGTEDWRSVSWLDSSKWRPPRHQYSTSALSASNGSIFSICLSKRKHWHGVSQRWHRLTLAKFNGVK